MEQEPIKTEEKRNPNGTFAPGTAPGPGRPKGQTLKEYWRERFQNMTDEEKIEFTGKVGNDLIWKMAEGNPKNDVDLNAKVTIADVIKEIEDGNDHKNVSDGTIDEPIAQIIGQTVEIAESIQDSGQEEESDSISAQQSTGALPAEQVVEKYNPEE